MSDHEFKRYTTDTAPEGSRGLMKDIQSSYGFMPELFAYMAESAEALEAYVTVNKLMAKTSLVKLAQTIVEKTGRLEDDDLTAFYDAGFGPKQVIEVILGVSLKTLSNYTNHLTHPEPNPELLKMLGS